MHELIRDYPLATLVTTSANGVNANHIPLHLAVTSEPYGTLIGHVARANTLLDDINGADQALAIFHGPNAYITPSWYETKKEHGKVVPTCNYAVVHAYGILRVVDSPEWLRTQLEVLTNGNERSFPEPWSVDDAPLDFIEKLLPFIIGFEMQITQLIGKWKMSQNQPPQNLTSVIAGLSTSNQSDAQNMAEFVKEASKN